MIRTVSYTRVVLYLSALFVAGCSAGTAVPQSSTSWAQPAASQLRVVHPDAGGHALLYVTSYVKSAVKTYDWPSLKPEQTLKGFTHEDGLCSDAKGNVFVANTNGNDIVEYAHGGTTPIATLKDLPYYFPNSCAVDPVSGDLAVTNLAYYNSGTHTANFVIFKNAAGKPKAYVTPAIYSYFMCGYDDRGNLVVDGLALHGPAAFAILQHGSQKLEDLTLDQAPPDAGGVQWDGKHWAIGDGYATIDQFDITGTKGTKVGATVLQESATVTEFFIDGDRVIVPEHDSGRVQTFAYPAGGAAIATIKGLHMPFGATISK